MRVNCKTIRTGKSERCHDDNFVATSGTIGCDSPCGKGIPAAPWTSRLKHRWLRQWTTGCAASNAKLSISVFSGMYDNQYRRGLYISRKCTWHYACIHVTQPTELLINAGQHDAMIHSRKCSISSEITSSNQRKFCYKSPRVTQIIISHFGATCHDDVIKWKHFPRNWPFVRGIHRWPMTSPHKGQWRGALMFLWSAPE